MNEKQNQMGIVKAADKRPDKVRYGAPDGPRKQRRGKYDGRDPLEFPGHEAVAQYLSAPKALREFKSDSELAKHFQVERMTIYRWKHDPDVIQRAHWLAGLSEMAGDLVVRREWLQIMQKAVERAKKGDMQAIKFCESRAWRAQMRVEQSQLSASVLLEDLLGSGETNEGEDLQDDEEKEAPDEKK